MKKYLSLFFTVTLCILFLVACTSKKEAYESDIKLWITYVNNFEQYTNEDVEVYSKAVIDGAKSVNMQTKEGKALMADFVELGELMAEYGNATDEDDVDTDAIEDLSSQRDQLDEKMLNDAQALGDAAEAAGVTSEVLDGLKY